LRTLTTTLQTAINASTRRPALTLTAEDHIQHYTLYQSPGNPDAYSDALVAPDNSIIRAQVTRSGFTSSAQFQRITDPSVASQWTTWTNLPGGTANMFQDGGVAISLNSGNTIRIFAQQGTGGNALYNWYSSNNGVTWNGPGIVLSPPGGALIKGIASAGNNDVFLIYDVAGGERIGFSIITTNWGPLVPWTLATFSQGSGLAAWYGAPGPSGVYNIVYSDGYSLKQCTYNTSGGTWSNVQTITPTTSTALIRTGPRLSYDAAAQLMTLACIEGDSGLMTGSVYSYPRLRQSPDMQHWSNGLIVHGLSSNYGVNALALPNGPNSGTSGARYYVTGKAAIFSAPMYAASNTAQYKDLSNAVLSYRRTDRQDKPARLDVLIDNASGVYSSFVCTGGAYAPMGPNTMLVLSEGYFTTNGKEVVNVGRYHIQQITFERTPEENRIRLVAYDVSRNLDTESRYQLTYTNQSMSWLVAEVCARAGIFFVNIPAAGQINQTVPTFTLHAGQTYRAALNELASVYDLVYFLDQSETLQVIDRSTNVTSMWTYRPEVELVSFGTDDLRANHIIVSGKPPFGGQAGSLTTAEAYDDTHASLVGLERMVHHTDQKLTTTAQCSLKAGFLIAEQQRSQLAHSVTVPANPGLQISDVITVTDSAAPTGSGQGGSARIIESTVQFDAATAHYEQHFLLQGA